MQKNTDEREPKLPGDAAHTDETELLYEPSEALDGEEERLQRLEEENEKLRQEIERVKNLTAKERIYDRVHVSVRTMDVFIAVMVLLLIGVIVLGLLEK